MNHGNAIVSAVPKRKLDLNDSDDLRAWLAENIMGYAEVCDELAVQRTNLKFIKDLPEPVAERECGRIWIKVDIQSFAKVYNARRDRRKKAA